MGRRSSKLTTRQHFESRFAVDSKSGCWIWSAGTRRRSNGEIEGRFIIGKETRAARCSWLIYRGAIPPKLHVLHTCDVALCVNPDHLYLGTHDDNMRDKAARRRHQRFTDRDQYMEQWASKRFNSDGKPLASTRLTKEDIMLIRFRHTATIPSPRPVGQRKRPACTSPIRRRGDRCGRHRTTRDCPHI